VAMPNLRRGARGHYHRATAPLPRSYAPAAPVTPAPGAPPNQELRWLCCEGACSPGIRQFAKREPELYEARFAPTTMRAAESAALTHTLHYFVRTNQLAHTVYHMWACVQCGNERVYGCEEA